MVLQYYGLQVPVAELGEVIEVGASGTTAFDLLGACERYGLPAIGVDIRGMPSELLPQPAIVHWTGSHFVVLELAHPEEAVVIDPRKGRHTMNWTGFWANYSGVALAFCESTTPGCAAGDD